MPRISKRPKLVLTVDEEHKVRQTAQSRLLPYREVQRAQILCYYNAGNTIKKIAQQVNTTRRIVYKCIDKALDMGIDVALSDLSHGSEPVITEEDKSWVIRLACCKPKDFGYAAELWSLKALAEHVRKEAATQEHPALCKAVKATVHRILAGHDLKPHKVRYYLERRDPNFEAKMKEVLVVYREVNSAPVDGIKTIDGHLIYTVSVDEKPGVQALANIAPDLPPVPDKHPTVSRDYEYKRLGTASILAGLDLQDGHIIARVERRHRSREFVDLLKDMDRYYPKGAVIRLILDNHSAHISKETRAYLATVPNRFRYVHTPTHGSWLNLVETLFGKMARTFLRGMRVDSWNELKTRILKGIAEINESPFVHRWSKFKILES